MTKIKKKKTNVMRRVILKDQHKNYFKSITIIHIVVCD